MITGSSKSLNSLNGTFLRLMNFTLAQLLLGDLIQPRQGLSVTKYLFPRPFKTLLLSQELTV